MKFLEDIKEFLSLCSELNYDISQIYAQSPNGVYSIGLILLLIGLIVVLVIRRSIKISSAIKLTSQIQNAKSYDEYNEQLTKLAVELPKRGHKLAKSIDIQKNEILNKELELLKGLNISDMITKYKQISAQYALIAQNSKKYKMSQLTSYYEEKSKTLLAENLNNEIIAYYEECLFTPEDVTDVNSIVAYANTTENPDEIITPLINNINRFSFAFNFELFRFTKALDKTKSAQVYINCNGKLNDLFSNGNEKISNSILSYMLENDEKEKVYEYISTMENKVYLQDLYYNYFAKTEDIDLDLAFVSNETKIDANYKDSLDSKLTSNWKDISYIKYIIESPRVLETIGHIDYRNVLERIEKLEQEVETNNAISEALEIARRAESIANEAKAIARQK